MFINANQSDRNNFDIEQIINDIDTIRKEKRGRYLTTTKRNILRGMLLEQSYPQISKNYGMNKEHIKKTGGYLCNELSQLFKEEINKKNIRATFERKTEFLSEAAQIIRLKKESKKNNQTPELIANQNLDVNKESKLNQEWKNGIAPTPNSLELPGGSLTANSRFYIEIPKIESLCYEVIVQPAGLLNIIAPPKTGKTTLTDRLLRRVSWQGYQTATIDFKTVDRKTYESLDSFLQWLCVNISLALNQEAEEIEPHWNPSYGAKTSSKLCLEKGILSQSANPLVLALDKLEYVYRYSQIANDFFQLIRAWHELGKKKEIWSKLRLILVASEEILVDDKYNSPFNVGETVELPNFYPEQVKELSNRFGLNLTDTEISQLINKVGTNPYLIHQSLYDIQRKYQSLDQFFQQNLSELKPYKDYPQYLP